MARIRVSTVIDAPPKVVWAAIEDVETHVDWMDDAVAIHITSDERRGTATTFECDTKIGPFRLTDRMAITEWDPPKAMGVSHTGLVTGSGVFRLKRLRRGRTVITWTERLRFPWWMGGPLGALAARPVLRHIWSGNLEHLKALVEEHS
jgi:hypothetical protein